PFFMNQWVRAALFEGGGPPPSKAAHSSKVAGVFCEDGGRNLLIRKKVVKRAAKKWLGRFCLGLVHLGGVLREGPEPAAVELSFFFERNNTHSPLGALELILAKPTRCASFFDDGYRCRSVRQDIRQKHHRATWIFVL